MPCTLCRWREATASLNKRKGTLLCTKITGVWEKAVSPAIAVQKGLSLDKGGYSDNDWHSPMCMSLHETASEPSPQCLLQCRFCLQNCAHRISSNTEPSMRWQLPQSCAEQIILGAMSAGGLQGCAGASGTQTGLHHREMGNVSATYCKVQRFSAKN